MWRRRATGVAAVVLGAILFVAGLIDHWVVAPKSALCQSGIGQIGQAIDTTVAHDCGLVNALETAVGWLLVLGVLAVIFGLYVIYNSRATPQPVPAAPWPGPPSPYPPPAQPYAPPAQPYAPPAQPYAPPAQPYPDQRRPQPGRQSPPQARPQPPYSGPTLPAPPAADRPWPPPPPPPP
jgi:hypothetical protein